MYKRGLGPCQAGSEKGCCSWVCIYCKAGSGAGPGTACPLGGGWLPSGGPGVAAGWAANVKEELSHPTWTHPRPGTGLLALPSMAAI
jgi:hypothetical protein